MPAPIPEPVSLPPDTPSLTVTEYIESWLEDHVRRRLTKSTYEGYSMVMKNWWLPRIGHIALNELRADDIQEVIEAMRTAGLASTTIKVAHQHLSTALERAVANRVLDRNPARVVRLPRRSATSIKRMDQEQMQRFIHAALMPSGSGGYWWYGPLIATALMTGMRSGELRGLQWGCIELDDHIDEGEEICGMIHVMQQIPNIEKNVVFSPPKSFAGQRDIPVTRELAMLLEGQKRRLERHALRRGTRSWDERDLVFPNRTGRAAVPEAMLRTCKDIAHMADVDPAPNMISLRHTFASVMVDGGVPPQVVAELLGHADVRLTLNTYYTATPPAQREALAALRAAMGVGGRKAI